MLKTPKAMPLRSKTTSTKFEFGLKNPNLFFDRLLLDINNNIPPSTFINSASKYTTFSNLAPTVTQYFEQAFARSY